MLLALTNSLAFSLPLFSIGCEPNVGNIFLCISSNESLGSMVIVPLLVTKPLIVFNACLTVFSVAGVISTLSEYTLEIVLVKADIPVSFCCQLF